MKSILILTPFRNEEHSIPQYLKSLRAVNYPPELIDVYWLENDSSDNTLKMLEDSRSTMPFNDITLDSIKILGSVKKQRPGEYEKDIPYGPKRVAPWIEIWNNHLLPFIRISHADYVMPWYADGLVEPDVITEFLKVFETHHDAGWVGGALNRRWPRQRKIYSPLPNKHAYSNKIVRVDYTAHVWMMPRMPLTKCVFGFDPAEMHFTLIRCLAQQGLYVYYQPSVFIQHVSTDGVVHTKSLK